MALGSARRLDALRWSFVTETVTGGVGLTYTMELQCGVKWWAWVLLAASIWIRIATRHALTPLSEAWGFRIQPDLGDDAGWLFGVALMIAFRDDKLGALFSKEYLKAWLFVAAVIAVFLCLITAIYAHVTSIQTDRVFELASIQFMMSAMSGLILIPAKHEIVRLGKWLSGRFSKLQG